MNNNYDPNVGYDFQASGAALEQFQNNIMSGLLQSVGMGGQQQQRPPQIGDDEQPPKVSKYDYLMQAYKAEVDLIKQFDDSFGQLKVIYERSCQVTSIIDSVRRKVNDEQQAQTMEMASMQAEMMKKRMIENEMIDKRVQATEELHRERTQDNPDLNKGNDNIGN